MAAARLCASGSSRQSSEDHRVGGRGSEGTKESERQESSRTWWDYWPYSEALRWSACWFFTSIFNESLATSVVPTSFKKSVIIPVPKNNKLSCLNDYRPVALTYKLYNTIIQIKIRLVLFVTYTIIQSIMSEMRSLHLTHPSADIAAPGNSWGFGALPKGLTSVVDTSCQSRDSNPQPWVTSGFKSNALSIRPWLPYIASHQ